VGGIFGIPGWIFMQDNLTDNQKVGFSFLAAFLAFALYMLSSGSGGASYLQEVL